MKKSIVFLGIIVLMVCMGIMTTTNMFAQPAKDKTLKISCSLTTTVENPWNRAFLLALDKAKAKGYKFEMNYVERCTKENIARVLSSLCAQNPDIIFDHSSLGYDDLLSGIQKQYQKIIFVGGGISYKPIAPNVGFYDVDNHEASYLCGVIAGMLTKTKIIGAVAAFPTPQQNEIINAFKRGALSVNPNTKMKVTFLQTWFDPAKGKEAALTQIAAGADLIFAERPGVAQACQEKGIYAFGNFLDHHETAPDTIITSALVDWSVSVSKIMDGVLANKFEPKEYTYGMREGGADIAPYYNFEKKLPKTVLDKVREVKAKIMDGSLTVPRERGKALAD